MIIWGIGSRIPVNTKIRDAQVLIVSGTEQCTELAQWICEFHTGGRKYRFQFRFGRVCDVKPENIGADCMFIEKISNIKWTYAVQTHVVQGSAVCIHIHTHTTFSLSLHL